MSAPAGDDLTRAPCSEQSEACGEPLIGSAGTAPELVAFSWPKPLWHHDKAALSGGVPAHIAELEQRCARASRKLALRVFQRAPGSATGRVELIAAHPGEARSLHERELPLEQLASRIEAFLSGACDGAPLREPQLLVCTDGRHDRCCAAHGRALFDALVREIAGRGADVSLAECSHLGGHRLAATCIALPSGRMYGRLRAEHAGALLDAVLAQRVFLPCYRGRLGLSELEQVAEAEALRRWPDARNVSFAPSDDAGIEATIELAHATHTLRLRCERREYRSAASCSEPESELRTRWIAPVELA